MAAAFVLLGLAGSLPLMLSPIQSGFYLVPAFAPFAIGLAVLARPSAEALLAWLDRHGTWRGALTAAFALLVLGALGYSATRVGKIGRGGTTIADVRAIGRVVPGGATVGICPQAAREWSLHGYFMLYDRIALDPNSLSHEWFVVDSGACAPPPWYERVDVPAGRFALFRAP
jgi:hypothetical protein